MHPQGSANPATLSKRPAGNAYAPKPALGELPKASQARTAQGRHTRPPRNGGAGRRRCRTAGNTTAPSAQAGVQSITLEVILKVCYTNNYTKVLYTIIHKHITRQRVQGATSEALC